MQHPTSPGIRTAKLVRKAVRRATIVFDTIPELEATSVASDEENHTSMGAFLTKRMSMSVIGRREEQQDERVVQLQQCDESKQREIYQRLVAFVPKEARMKRRSTDGSRASTIMLCDISGFTTMTERLSMKGVSGIGCKLSPSPFCAAPEVKVNASVHGQCQSPRLLLTNHQLISLPCCIQQSTV